MKKENKFTVTVTYYNDCKGEWVTVPLSEAPDELINPSATVTDIAKMHAEMRAELKSSYDAYDDMDEMEYQEWYSEQQEVAQKAAEIEMAYKQRYA